MEERDSTASLSRKLRRLCERFPSLAEEHMVRRALENASIDSAFLLDICKGLILNPYHCIQAAMLLRPALLGVVASLINDELQVNESSRAPLVSCALPRLLFIAPHLKGEVLRYFERRPGPHVYLSQKGTEQVQCCNRSDLVESSLWGLLYVTELRYMWGWVDFLALISDADSYVRWCCRKCLGLLGVDQMPDELAESHPDPTEHRLASMRWHTATADMVTARTQMWYSSESLVEGIVVEQSGYVELSGLLVPQKAPPVAAHSLLLTSSLEKTLRCFAMGLSLNEPILIEGPPASGKSALIAHAASVTGNCVDLINIHLDDQTDSKSLLGTYVCASEPGRFVWQPGPLAQAVKHGTWVVIEAINLAPPDVLAILLSLVEHRTLHIPSRGEEIHAAKGFQLIATVTTHPGGLNSGFQHNYQNLKEKLSGYFFVTETKPFSLEDQMSIICHRYPDLRPLVPYALLSITTMQIATKQYNVQHMDEKSLRFAMDILWRANLRPGERPLGRYFGFQDALKWAKRMTTIHDTLLNRSLRGNGQDNWDSAASLPISVREASYLEIVDCLAAGVPEPRVLKKILVALADIWAIPEEFVLHHNDLAKPQAMLDNRSLNVGRVAFLIESSPLKGNIRVGSRRHFAQTGHSMRTLERLLASVTNCEPVLLVGETGTGKTTSVQELADIIQAKLVVVNVSQQTDSSDLIGGFKPVQPNEGLRKMLPEFIDLVQRTWSRGNNEEFIKRVARFGKKQKWEYLKKAYRTALAKVKNSLKNEDNLAALARPQKKQRRSSIDTASECLEAWENFSRELEEVEGLTKAAQGGFAFAFVEGVLIQAIRNGWWLLLDEINLAPPEVLERITSVMENETGSITVMERGDVRSVHRHSNFRLFGAMNPATDAGKRELPVQIRTRFTEFWMGEPTSREDLAKIVAGYLRPVTLSAPIESVVEFYIAAKEAAQDSLQDGAGHKPAYNLRTLTRALEYACNAINTYGLKRALYDGLAMSFLTQLEPSSAEKMDSMLRRYLLDKDETLQAVLKTPAHPPPNEGHCVLFDHFWVQIGDAPVATSKDIDGKGGVFVTTPTITRHLRNLARAILLFKYPILLQGPTSSGKTSLVAYLAAQTGHHFIRINNHEQTDLQEYLGTYISDDQGRLIFQEGPLVQALRNGYWVVLDELNLAPTDVLEALNRLLDDNRELFIPELQEVVKPHPQFMLFATQNPPGLYAGRKVLSRAFRSRFLELHIEDIPDDELHLILEKRCKIAPTYAIKLVTAMRELQRRRAISNVFAGRHGYITPRDLFRWAERHAVGYQQLAEDGFALLGERLRNSEERNTVREVLEKVMRTKISMEDLYGKAETILDSNGEKLVEATIGRIVWTRGFRRMAWLLSESFRHAEPALLVGETGLGKTSACQLVAISRSQKLRIVNCNQHTEASDFLGGYRPNRGREFILKRMCKLAESLVANLKEKNSDANIPNWPKDVSLEFLEGLLILMPSFFDSLDEESQKIFLDQLEDVKALFISYRSPFVWEDGPLVQAMRKGDIILIDEINLAEDAVIERLNSVLEPGGSLTLAEKGGATVETIIPHPNFRIVATMNPGGDFGKKELSPALNNRFTTIWIPTLEDEFDMRVILESRLQIEDARNYIPSLMIGFLNFFQHKISCFCRQRPSIRDLLTWVDFVNANTGILDSSTAYLHGAYLAFIDGLGLGVGLSDTAARRLKEKCFNFLKAQFSDGVLSAFSTAIDGPAMGSDGQWGLHPFYIDCGTIVDNPGFSFDAPTTAKNAFSILRALQVKKPILLEGSPGVGKTSLIAAISAKIGRNFVRINLSEQTDMMDLLGADLPTDGGNAGDFAWSDGPLLAAIKSGSWVLLDELNLANQTILEGLNALLDHRAEVFIPELNQTYKCASGFRIFGAQNPLQEGGGRKGLPRSFLNRFSRVHIELLQRDDLIVIASAMHPEIHSEILQKMVDCVIALHRNANEIENFGKVGGPWEFNLRDLLRWCQLMKSCEENPSESIARYYADLLFTLRMRTMKDRLQVKAVVENYFDAKQENSGRTFVHLGTTYVRVGLSTVPRTRACFRNAFQDSLILRNESAALFESIMKCIELQWLCLLIGPSGVGKTTALRCVAQMCGEDLVELPLNSGTDASDLLGGFEQCDPDRTLNRLCARLENVLRQVLTTEIWKSISRNSWNACENLARFVGVLKSSKSDQKKEKLMAAIKNVHEILEGHRDINGVSNLLVRVEKIQEESAILVTDDSSTARFEWVDGSLTSAIIEGRWVLLENANLCNPSVLDRLNSLLEPNGVLYMNECGTLADGKPRILKPHRNFRLFLVLDPKNGEVSRAMRNRGIEIYLLQSSDSGLFSIGRENILSQHSLGIDADKEIRQSDLESLLGSAHCLNKSLSSLFISTHMQIGLKSASAGRNSGAPCLRDLKRWVKFTENLTSRGIPFADAVAFSFESVYSDWSKQLSVIANLDLSDFRDSSWWFPGVWPLPMTVDHMVLDTEMTRFLRNIGPVLYWTSVVLVSGNYGELCMGSENDASTVSKIIEKLRANCLGACAMLPGDLLLDIFSGVRRNRHFQYDIEMYGRRQTCQATLDRSLLVFFELCGGDMEDAARAAELLRQCERVLALFQLRNGLVLGDIASMIDLFCAHPLLVELRKEDDVASRSPELPLRVLRNSFIRRYVQRRISHDSAEINEGPSHDETTSLLQLSSLRFKHPNLRFRLPSPHPAIDWIWPLFSEFQRFEKHILDAGDEAGNCKILCVAGLPKLVLTLQERCWRFLQVCHEDALARASDFALHSQHFIYAWMELKHCIDAVVCSIDFEDAAFRNLLEVANQLDLALDLDSRSQLRSELWYRGGKPSLPGRLQDLDASDQLRKLCGALTFSEKENTAIDAIIGNAIMKASSAVDGTGIEIDPELRSSVLRGIISDAELRRSVFEGACLMQAAIYRQYKQKGEDVAPEILESLSDAMENHAFILAKQISSGQASSLNLYCIKEMDSARMPSKHSLLSVLQSRSPQSIGFSLVADVRVTKRLFRLLGGSNSPLLSFMCKTQAVDDQLIHNMRETVSETLIDGSQRNLYEGTPYMLLGWLEDAFVKGYLDQDRKQELQLHAVHEAWFLWHQSLWETEQFVILPEEVGPSSTHPFPMKFQCGPNKLHTCALSSSIASFVLDDSASVNYREVKRTQLRKLARQLNDFSSDDHSYEDTVLLEWRAAVLILAATLNAYYSDVADIEDTLQSTEYLEYMRKLRAVIDFLLTTQNFQDFKENADELGATISSFISSHKHAVFQDIGQAVLLPILQDLFSPRALGKDLEGLRIRGRIWVSLGLARFHLLLPTSGTDPALSLELQCQDAYMELQWSLRPEAIVRQMYSSLPGMGSLQHDAMTEISKKILELERYILKAKGLSPPRPVPPKYSTLREDLLRFSRGVVEISKVMEIVNRLGSDAREAITEAKSWQKVTSAAMERLTQLYPGYRDIIQPLELSLKEIQYGLELIILGKQFVSTRNVITTDKVAIAVQRFSSFPRYWLEHELNAESETESSSPLSYRMVLADLARVNALNSSIDKDEKERHRIARRAELESHIEVLRTALSEEKQAWHASFTRSEQRKVLERIRSIFNAFVLVWRDLKEEEARKEAEEATVFKVRKSRLFTEEEEEEQSFQERFPDQFSMFEDLDPELVASFNEDEERSKNTPLENAQEAYLSADTSSAFDVRNILLGPVLREIIKMQLELFGDTDSRAFLESWASMEQSAVEDFIRSYSIGIRALQHVEGALPAWLDTDIVTGHLYAISIQGRKLEALKASCCKETFEGNRRVESIDMYAGNVSEAILIHKPLDALQGRLSELLKEWPDHPVLSQLHAIIERILDFPIQSPLKKLLTGLELLLAKAQLWEETAARHVSLESGLRDVAALASRWRKLELDSWRGLLARTSAQVSECSFESWFHLYGILFDGNSSVQETAAVIGDYLQTSPLGEYAARLSIISGFQGQIEALGPKDKDQKDLLHILQNIHKYYRQFLPAVESTIKSKLAQHEKDLEDFVRLAKWEDRGFYAMKASTEKAQRHLHRLSRRVMEVLKEPVTGTLQNTATSMGIDELYQPENIPMSLASHDAMMKELNWNTGSVISQLSTFNFSSLSVDNMGSAMRAAVLEPGFRCATKYVHRLSDLSRRFSNIIGGRLDMDNSAAAHFVNDLASQIAERAFALQSDVGRGAKSRKKKALIDLFHTFESSGISKLRTAIPANKRGPQAWFKEPSLSFGSLFLIDMNFLAVDEKKAAKLAWTKADSYLFASMARLQRLMEAAQHPHPDISSSEASHACNYAEHLLYLINKGRNHIHEFSIEFCLLQKLDILLVDLVDDSKIDSHQKEGNQELRRCQRRLKVLLSLTKETREMLLEVSLQDPENSERAVEAARILRGASASLEEAKKFLEEALNCTLLFSDGSFLITSRLRKVLIAINSTIQDIYSDLALREYLQKEPGWVKICAMFASVCTVDSSRMESMDRLSISDQEHIESLCSLIDASIGAALMWAQSFIHDEEDASTVDEANDDDPTAATMKDGIQKLPDEVEAAGRRLGTKHLRSCMQSYMEAAKLLYLIADSGDDATIQRASQVFRSAAPLIRMLCISSWQAAARYLALHRSIAKLAYVCSSVLLSVAEKGFCIPDVKDGEHEELEDSKVVEGTGFGEADTRHAKDISNELEEQDQLLGAQQKDTPMNEQEQKESLSNQRDEPQGIEMDDDFEGDLHELEDEAMRQDDDEDESDGERLEQQMGDVGDTGEDVDEKLWNGNEDEGCDSPEREKKEDGYDRDHEIKVEDASNLEYAQGADEVDEQQDDEQCDKNKAMESVDRPNDASGIEEEESEVEEGDYHDRPEDRGFVQPEVPDDEEMKLPDQLALDGDIEEEQETQAEDIEIKEEQIQDKGKHDSEQKDHEDGFDSDNDAGPKEEEDHPNQEQENEKNSAEDDGVEKTDFGFLENQKETVGEENEEAPEDKEEGADMFKEPEVVRKDDKENDSLPVQNDGGKGQHFSSMTNKSFEESAEQESQQMNHKAHGLDADRQQNHDEHGAAGPTSGLENDGGVSQMVDLEAQNAAQPQKESGSDMPEVNPFRSLGSALQRWKKRLKIVGDAPEEAQDEDHLEPMQEQLAEDHLNEELPTSDFRYLRDKETEQVGDMQTLAAATEEQVMFQTEGKMGDEERDDLMEEDDTANPYDVEDSKREDADIESEKQAEAASNLATGKTLWGAGTDEKAALQQLKETNEEMREEDDENMEDIRYEDERMLEDGKEHADHDMNLNSIVSLRLASSDLDDGVENQEEEEEESDSAVRDRMDFLRKELDRRLQAASEGNLSDSNIEHGQIVWNHCEALTSNLVGELTEQLRLILEPSLATKLGGEYRTGKRINMKRVIAYIASHFRKDKIWMRRTLPDKREYQVLVAVDDSRSMTENGCSTFAAEALALICRAMTRLEVGELGVVSFGGSGGAKPLHPLGEPFSEADGVKVMGQLRFDADNTISDQPMADVIMSIDHMLETAAAQASATCSSRTSLHQLVLIIADGRFHEKEALRRVARDASSRPGVLYAFIILDNASNSILEMQSVTFSDGKPVFTRYIDTFPFPYYIVLKDTSALPQTLADLLRQWFERSSLD